MTKNSWTVVAVIFFALLLGGIAYSQFQQAAPEMNAPEATNGTKPSENEEVSTEEETQPMRIGENAIYVPDQPSGDRVEIGFVMMQEGGYVVVHEDANGSFGNVIGASARLDSGETKNFSIDLTRDSKDGETLYAMLHQDNGDGVFSEAGDAAVIENGGPVYMIFTIDEDASAEVEIQL